MFLKSAQRFSFNKPAPNNLYHFPREHKAGWQAFWESMDGDTDKILDFAKKSDIDSPEEWFSALHLFLFDVFSGNPNLLKVASGKSFGEFLKQVAENHTKDPKDKNWYVEKGITKNKFIAALERAADIADVKQAIGYVNARIVNLGFYLYSEYLLAKTEGKSKLKSVASGMNKQAYELEHKALGYSPLEDLAIGDKIGHSLAPHNVFMVVDVVKDNSTIEMIVARDLHGKAAYIEDIWNVTVNA